MLGILKFQSNTFNITFLYAFFIHISSQNEGSMQNCVTCIDIERR